MPSGNPPTAPIPTQSTAPGWPPPRRWWLGGAMLFLAVTGFAGVFLAPRPPGVEGAGEPPAPRAAALPATSRPSAVELVTRPAVAVVEAPNPATPTVDASEATASALPAALPLKGGVHVAILVADLGADPALARAAIAELPPQVGIGLSPYGQNLGVLAEAARAAGHEVWVGVPMQPKRYPAIDPGRNSLQLALGADENSRRFAWALAQVPGAKSGFYNIMGSGFMARAPALLPVFRNAAAQGLGFVDARSDADSAGVAVARQTALRVAASRGFVDEPADGLPAHLDQLVATARREGSAVALVSGTRASVEGVAAWSRTLAAAGVTLASPGQLAR